MTAPQTVLSNLLRTLRPIHDENYRVTRDNVLIALMELRDICEEDRRPTLNEVCHVMNRRFSIRWTPMMLPARLIEAKERLSRTPAIDQLERLEREYRNGKNGNY